MSSYNYPWVGTYGYNHITKFHQGLNIIRLLGSYPITDLEGSLFRKVVKSQLVLGSPRPLCTRGSSQLSIAGVMEEGLH